MKFIALLRGINVGGNNIISMPTLKRCFEEVGFGNVVTYINSGNIIFDSDETDTARLVEMCEAAIEDCFGFHIICSVISADDLKAAMAQAPSWWGEDANSSHNALFAIAPTTAEEILSDIGEIKHEYEQVEVHEPIIFWSTPIATKGKTRYSKIAGTKAYKFVTIRNANTTKKLLELVS